MAGRARRGRPALPARRRFVLLLGFVPAAWLLAPLLHRRGRAADAADRAVAALGLRSLDPIALGRAYLADHPEEADARALRARLGVRSRSRDDGDPGEALRRARREDFDAGRVVTVDGWILSRTEARAVALAALGAR